MSTIPRYKRVPIDWEVLRSRIKAQGYSLNRLASEIGISPRAFTQAAADGKMNPAIVLEISKYVKFDWSSVVKETAFKRVDNGRSTEGRLGIDWLYLEKCAKERNYSLHELSEAVGRSYGYLVSCRREGGISEDVLIQIGDVLDIDYHTLIKTTSYDKWYLRKEIVDMLDSVDYGNKKNR